MLRWGIILLGVIMVAGGVLLLFGDAYGENIQGVANDIAINIVASKINESMKDGLYNDALDGPLLKAERDSEGYIQYIEPDTKLINRLLLEFSRGVKENYSLDDIEVVKVNLGVLTGSKIMSQLPFNAKLKVMPVSLTKFQCGTSFESEGINQTHYNVYCTVECSVRVVAPFSNEVIKFQRKYLVAEAVIVGKVPDNYVMVPKDSILDAIE